MISEDLMIHFCGTSDRQDLTAKVVPAIPGSAQSQKCRAEVCLGGRAKGLGW